MEPRTPLKAEDYTEPRCPLCTDAYQKEPPVKSIPLPRIFEKADELFGKKDFAGVERLYDYWLKEAKENRDQKGELALQNEWMGYFRKQGKKEEAYLHAEEALRLVDALGYEDSITGGTTFVNAATVRKAFDDASMALPLFEQALKIYEKELTPEDTRLGGLYNNMALACTDLRQFQKARELYGKALDVMKHIEHGELEQAMTYLNLADVAEAELGPEAAEVEIQKDLELAEALLKTPSLPENGYTAYVLEKCAPSFGYYGWFAAEQEFSKKAEQIYARS